MGRLGRGGFRHLYLYCRAFPIVFCRTFVGLLLVPVGCFHHGVADSGEYFTALY
uniref:Uncharacterized protein n=1 Tax=Anguilla anguilla TaxID=7936 RepID=A0A0E9XX96_ANGAN